MMKRLFFYIVCLFTIFNCSSASAQKYELPADFEGTSTLNLLQGEKTTVDTEDTVAVLWEIGQYFYNKYPDITVFYQEDFVEELRPFFPDDNEEELHQRLVLLRNVIDGYKTGKEVYDKFVEQKLVPHTYKKVRRENDFDKADEVPYIEAKEGEFVKVYNFKNFLSYAENADERKAIEDFKKKQQKELSFGDKVEIALDRIEWKKLPFYGYKYKNPLLSENGVSPFLGGKHISLHLLTPNTYVDGQKELYIGVHIITDSTHFVLANNLTDDLQKVSINLDNSENVKSYEVLYPVPFNSRTLPAYHKYFGDFLIPIKIEVEDVEKEIKISADVVASVCGTTEICATERFSPQLVIEPKGRDIFPNGYENFFAMTIAQNPQPETKKLRLEKLVVDDDENGQVLRLEFTAKEKVESFQVYIEENDGYTAFAAPLISLTDGKIFVRFVPQNKPKYDLKDSEFTVSAVLNEDYFLRQSRFAGTASMFDVDAPTLNWGLILLAILGGLLLNFMPCVFPVLSLKIIALSPSFGQRDKLRKSIQYTLGGIFIGFTLLILGLLIAKNWGISLGWGMQYQNMFFLVAMIFILSMFFIMAPRLRFEADLPVNFTNPTKRSDILLGTLIVLLATPCTGPYLATAIGFALTGNSKDIVVLLYAVAVGLSLPYLLVLLLKDPQNFFPKPGNWMNKLNVVLNLMLLAAIGWFFMLIYQQTDIFCVLKLGVIWGVFCLICKFYVAFMNFMEEQSLKEIPTEAMLRVRKYIKYVVIAIIAALGTGAMFIAQSSYNANYEKRLEKRDTVINSDLIREKLAQGRSVLLEIGADWCLTCHYNDAVVLTPKNLAYWRDVLHLDFMRVDWTDYNKQTLDFMARFGRKGLPFYILYTPFIREGMVLPEIFDAEDIRYLLMRQQ